MKDNLGKNFILGALLGALLCLLYWYWQKSTQAEDGALALLDRLKEVQDRLRRVEQGEALQVVEPESEDLTAVNGIGPVFAERLQQAGVHTIAHILTHTSQQLADILQIQSGRAEQILRNARAV